MAVSGPGLVGGSGPEARPAFGWGWAILVSGRDPEVRPKARPQESGRRHQEAKKPLRKRQGRGASPRAAGSPAPAGCCRQAGHRTRSVSQRRPGNNPAFPEHPDGTVRPVASFQPGAGPTSAAKGQPLPPVPSHAPHFPPPGPLLGGEVHSGANPPSHPALRRQEQLNAEHGPPVKGKSQWGCAGPPGNSPGAWGPSG